MTRDRVADACNYTALAQRGKSKLVPNLLLAALLATAALGAHAQRKTGFYVGAGVSQSFVDQGAQDDEDTAFSIFGGYRFHRSFALEAAYTDFGKTEPGGTGPNSSCARLR